MRRRDFIAGVTAAGAWSCSPRMHSSPSACGTSACSWLHGRGRCGISEPRRGVPAGAAAVGLVRSARNLRVDTRWATAQCRPTFTSDAAELAALAPDVILAPAAGLVGALLQATRTVPIVFPVLGDPVGAGFVDSLARPGGNATGFMNFEFSMGGKWLELLKEIAPGATRAAVLRDTAEGSGTSQFAVHPGRGAVAQGGGQPGQHARRWRNRTRRRGVRALGRMAA